MCSFFFFSQWCIVLCPSCRMDRVLLWLARQKHKQWSLTKRFYTPTYATYISEMLIICTAGQKFASTHAMTHSFVSEEKSISSTSFTCTAISLRFNLFNTIYMHCDFSVFFLLKGTSKDFFHHPAFKISLYVFPPSSSILLATFSHCSAPQRIPIALVNKFLNDYVWSGITKPSNSKLK